MDVEEGGDGVAEGGLALPLVVGVEALALAGLDVFDDGGHGGFAVLLDDGVEDALMVLVDALEGGAVVAAAMDGEDADEEAGVVDDLLDAGVLSHAHKESVEAEVAGDEALHAGLVEVGVAGGVELSLEGEDLVDEVLEAVLIGGAHGEAGDLGDGVDLQGLAELVELDDVFAGELGDDHTTTRTLVEEALGGELVHGLTDGGAAAAELFGEEKLGDAAAGGEGSLGDELLDVEVGLFADGEVACAVVLPGSAAHSPSILGLEFWHGCRPLSGLAFRVDSQD